ncbi:pyx [Symbiodinium sp. CCMP2456]|nr:pyx [Symbiodinium sp. CCMP2456]
MFSWVVLPFRREWVNLAHAVSYESQEKVERLLRYLCDPNMGDDDGTPCLHLAARRGDAGKVLLLLEAEADLEKEDQYDGVTALYMASAADSLETMRVLLDAGANKAKAVRCVCSRICRVGCGYDEDLDVKDGRRALQQLLQAQADINLADHSGRTPLHLLVIETVMAAKTSARSQVGCCRSEQTRAWWTIEAGRHFMRLQRATVPGPCKGF